MTKNRLTDLNDHLFAELERLGDEDLQGDELKQEISRANGVSQVAGKIIDNASLILKAKLAYQDNDRIDATLPELMQTTEMIEHEKKPGKLEDVKGDPVEYPPATS